MNTSRIFLRPFLETDMESFIQLHGEASVMHAIPLPVWDRQKSIEEFHKRLKLPEQENPSKWVWAVVLQETNSFIGAGGLVKMEDDSLEIGYRLLPEYWGEGYGTELAQELIQKAFSELNTHRVFAEAHVDNVGSNKILEKFLNYIGTQFSKQYKCENKQYELFKENWA